MIIFFAFIKHIRKEGALLHRDWSPCDDAKWQDLEDTSSRLAHEGSRTQKTKRNRTGRSCRVLLKLNEDDIRKLRQDFYNQMQEVVLDKIFEKMFSNAYEHERAQLRARRGAK